MKNERTERSGDIATVKKETTLVSEEKGENDRVYNNREKNENTRY